jgi:hypothetical protein
MRDPYESLAVARSATASSIKRSFRELAKKLHPDANNNDPKATALFAELKAAYDILGDEEKRWAFDRGEIDAEGKPTPQALTRRSVPSTSHVVTHLMVIMVMLFITAAVIMRGVTPEENISVTSDGSNRVVSGAAANSNEEPAPGAKLEQRQLQVQAKPRLILQQGVSYAALDSIPLGVRVSVETNGLSLEISGLPTGMTISSGRPIGVGAWRIPSREVDNAMIRPPAGFSGTFDLVFELRLADDSVVDSGSSRYQWLQSPTTPAAPINAGDDLSTLQSSVGKAVPPRPSISIVENPDVETKFHPQTIARTSSDGDARPESHRSVAPNQNGSETTAVIRPSTTPDTIDLTSIRPERPRFAVSLEKISLQRDQVWPLGTRITVEGRGGTLLVRGLAVGAKLSVGQPSDVDGWELSVEDLGGAVIIPPAGFVGTMDLTLSLRRGAATSDRQSLQVEWAGGTAAPPVPTARLEPSDAARLLQRGEESLACWSVARSSWPTGRSLRPEPCLSADNGEPRGAFALAETYEQSTLERLGAKGILPDTAGARTWYGTAKALGSTEAQHHLDHAPHVGAQLTTETSKGASGGRVTICDKAGCREAPPGCKPKSASVYGGVVCE